MIDDHRPPVGFDPSSVRTTPLPYYTFAVVASVVSKGQGRERAPQKHLMDGMLVLDHHLRKIFYRIGVFADLAL